MNLAQLGVRAPSPSTESANRVYGRSRYNRGMNDRKPSAGFWITVAVLAMLVLYPLSLGPACLISSRAGADGHAISVLYRPITWCLPTDLRPSSGHDVEAGIRWYSAYAAAPDWQWCLVFDGPGQPPHWEWIMVMPY